MKDRVKRLLREGKVDLFLGYKMVDGHPLPHFFVKDKIEEVDGLITGPARYPLEKIALTLTEEEPGIRVGLLVRDCNQRALNVLFVWKQLSPDNIAAIPVNCCPSRLTSPPDCSFMSPEKTGLYKKKVGIDKNIDMQEAKTWGRQERFKRWAYEFKKCIKCYGCRDSCPVCFCKECSLEHHSLIRNGDLPVEVPIFHLVRAVHMAGRCIDCGLCEDACPMDIPLRFLYKMVNQIVADVFDYRAGIDSTPSPFNILGDEVTLQMRALKPA